MIVSVDEIVAEFAKIAGGQFVVAAGKIERPVHELARNRNRIDVAAEGQA